MYMDLFEDKNLFKDFFYNAPFPMMMISNDGLFIDVNRAAVIESEYQKYELIGKPLETIFTDFEYQAGKLHFITVLKEGKSFGEVPIKTKGGKILNYRVFAIRVNNQMIIGISINITKEKIYLNELLKSEIKYKTYIKNAPVGHFIMDKTGKFLEVNIEATNQVDFPEEYILNKKAQDFFSPENPELGLKHMKVLLSRGKANGDVLVRDAQGKDHYFRMSGVKLEDDKFLLFSTETTELSIAKQQLEDSNQRLKKINRKLLEQQNELKKSRLEAEERQKYSNIIARLAKKLIEPGMSIEEIGDLIYHYTLRLTSSEYGYVSALNKELEYIAAQSLTEVLPQMCNVNEKKIVFPDYEKLQNIKCEDFNKVRAFFINNYPTMGVLKELPDGNVPIKNLIIVPVIVKDKLFGKIAVANKPLPYNVNDLNVIKELANIYGIAVYRKTIEDDLLNAKEKIEESERKYRLITENSTDVIWTMDLYLNYKYLSPSSERITGYTTEDRRRISDYELFDRDEYIKVKLMLKEWIKKHINDPLNATPFKFELKGIRADNSIFFVEVVGGFLIEDNKAIGLQGSTRDITVRKKIERELNIAKLNAEESDNLKSAFLANMSHEIRTPMNAIVGFSHLLLEKKLPKEKQRKFLEIIGSRSKDLLQIINDIIDISKIESNQMEIVKHAISLNELLNGLYDYYAYQSCINGKNIKFSIVKSIVKNDIIYTDSDRLKQILNNLLSNAFKFTEQGLIELGVSCTKDNIQFYVKDTGIGISTSEQEIIFQRFSQANKNTSKLYGGTGLGLAITKQLVELLGGKIWVESELNKGSCFYFIIPIVEENKNINMDEFKDLNFRNHNEKGKIINV